MDNSLYVYRPGLYWNWWKEFFHPWTYWRWIKWHWQRAFRGYADCDVWDLYGYTAEVLVGAIAQLRAKKQGYPVDVMLPEHQDGAQESDAESEASAERWKAELQMMVDGFQAAMDLSEVPDRFVTRNDPITFGPVDEQGLSEMHLGIEFDWPALRAWQDERSATMNRGLAKFSERFQNLWD